MSQSSVIKQICTIGKQILPEGSHLWLYGSRARDDYHAGSDWDLMVLINHDVKPLDDFTKYAYPFVEMGWEIGENINPLLYSHQEWEKRNFTPFYHNVEHDKMVLV